MLAWINLAWCNLTQNGEICWTIDFSQSKLVHDLASPAPWLDISCAFLRYLKRYLPESLTKLKRFSINWGSNMPPKHTWAASACQVPDGGRSEKLQIEFKHVSTWLQCMGHDPHKEAEPNWRRVISGHPVVILAGTVGRLLNAAYLEHLTAIYAILQQANGKKSYEIIYLTVSLTFPSTSCKRVSIRI